MAIWLLTVEMAAAALLAMAWNAAGRQQRRPADRLLAASILSLLSVLVLLALPLAIAVMLRSAGTYPHYLPHALLLWLVVLAGGIWIIRAGMQLRGNVRAAATWPAKRIGLGLFLCILLFGATLTAFVSAAQGRARQIRTDSWTRYHDLLGPCPAESENAAPLYRMANQQITDAFARFDAQHPESPAAQVIATDQEPAAEPLRAQDLICERGRAATPEFRDLVQRLEPAVRQLHAASALPACRFQQYIAMPAMLEDDPGLRTMRQAANVLSAHAVVMARQGDLPAATRDVLAIRNIAAHASQTRPSLISSLVEIGIEALGDAATAEILPYASDSASLAALARTSDGPSETKALRQGLTGEQLLVSHTLAGIPMGKPLTGPGGPQQNTTGWAAIGYVYGLFFLDHDIATWRQISDPAVAGAQSPGQYKGAGRVSGSLLLNILQPSLESAVNNAGGRGLASRRCADLAIALTRYRLEHGTYPSTLEALVPAYLAAVPADPFDGAPLRCKLAPESATVYSIGINRKDDGGDVDESDNHRPKDIGFHLAKPAR